MSTIFTHIIEVDSGLPNVLVTEVGIQRRDGPSNVSQHKEYRRTRRVCPQEAHACRCLTRTWMPPSAVSTNALGSKRMGIDSSGEGRSS